jgi:hypothetical protein
MKTVYVVMISAVLGATLGAAISWANFGNAPPPPGHKALVAQPTPQAGQPKVLVSERSYDFGAVERDTTVRHTFHFSNIGNAVLTLRAGTTTCTKCTIAELEKPEVKPGETVDVVVEYIASVDQPRFRQMAPIITNDPEQQRVELNISGKVTSKYRVIPDQLVLSKVSANETKTAEIKIVAFLADEVKLVSHEFLGAETAAYFEARSEPIPKADLKEEDAKSGCRVIVTLKPGLPLGPFRQTIRLTLQMGDAEDTTVEVGIFGSIDSDISIVGPGWNDDLGKLTIDSVKRAEGATRKLLLLVRGDHRHDLTIKPVKLDPPWLKVKLGEPSPLAGGTVVQVPLTIEIPPGTAPVNRLGSEQAKLGEIVLETSHPQAKQIRLYLKFAIE